MRRLEIPKRGAPGKTRPLGIPSVYDRVCQQALVNRLEPIFEKVFDPSSFGYRKGRKPSDALGKIWREVGAGGEWIVDADLKDYFGSVDHEKLMTLVGKQVADGRVLNLIQQMLKAGYEEKGQRYETPRGTPQGGVVSPLLSNILLTPFDKEMRQKGYLLTRWADDWVVTCRTRAEAENALARATKILDKLGVTLFSAHTFIIPSHSIPQPPVDRKFLSLQSGLRPSTSGGRRHALSKLCHFDFVITVQPNWQRPSSRRRRRRGLPQHCRPRQKRLRIPFGRPVGLAIRECRLRRLNSRRLSIGVPSSGKRRLPMRRTSSLLRSLLIIVGAGGALLAETVPALAGYVQTDLVSDIPGMALITDPDFVEPLGRVGKRHEPILGSGTKGPATSTL